MQSSFARAVAAALLLASPLAIAQVAQDLPKRKPGLWQHNVTSIGAPAPATAMTMCTDERMDKMLADRPDAQRCSQQTVRRDGNAVVVEAVCMQQNSTVRTRGRFSGDFNSNYSGEMHSTFDPPLHGMKESRQKIDARWIGPCKPGQKPGDVQVEGMPGGMNVHEMMKGMDPKQMEEMMRQMEKMKGVKPQ
jgi:hypothetical protein